MVLVCNLTYDQTNTKNVEKALFPNSFSLIRCEFRGGQEEEEGPTTPSCLKMWETNEKC